MLDLCARVSRDESAESAESDEKVMKINEYLRDLPCELPGGLNASDVGA